MNQTVSFRIPPETAGSDVCFGVTTPLSSPLSLMTGEPVPSPAPLSLRRDPASLDELIQCAGDPLGLDLRPDPSLDLAARQARVAGQIFEDQRTQPMGLHAC